MFIYQTLGVFGDSPNAPFSIIVDRNMLKTCLIDKAVPHGKTGVTVVLKSQKSVTKSILIICSLDLKILEGKIHASFFSGLFHFF
jgi:hypothetical protein